MGKQMYHFFSEHGVLIIKAITCTSRHVACNVSIPNCPVSLHLGSIKHQSIHLYTWPCGL